MSLRLAIFDCDGTLADSEASIVDAVTAAFAGQGLTPPRRKEIVASIGLSLDHFLNQVAAGIDAEGRTTLLDAYRDNFARLREERGADPLFAGMRGLLTRLEDSGILLGIATGKSRRGLVRFLEAHDMAPRFATLQTADDAPSKPHPGMIERALEETGTQPHEAVMIGDTTFDIGAGVNAGVRSIGVDWGHHDEAALLAAGADCVVTDATALERVLLGE